MFQAWHEYDVDPDWAATLSDAERVFVTGSNRWLWRQRVRQLADVGVETLASAKDKAREEAARLEASAARARVKQGKLGTVR